MIPYWTMQWKEQIHLRFRTGCSAVLRKKDCTKCRRCLQKQYGPGLWILIFRWKREHGYLYIPGTEPETVTINGQEQKSDYWNNNFLDLGTYDTDTVVHVTAETGMQESGSGNLPGIGPG